MEILNNILESDLQNALAWTLLHSFWQGALITMLFGVVTQISGKQPARTRYYISVIFLLFFLIVTVYTFVVIYTGYRTQGDNMASRLADITLPAGDFRVNNMLRIPTESGWLAGLSFSFSGFLARYSYIITLSWLAGMLFLATRMAGGLLVSGRIRKSALPCSDHKMKGILERMKVVTGVKKLVLIAETTLIKVPAVTGYLKPVILVPVGLLSGIPCEQVEAIIAHELAHIKRGDYIINLIQTVIEVLLFFHPGVWLISSYIRRERENCCDDIAMSSGFDQSTYARALLNMYDLSVVPNGLQVAATGRSKDELLNRIKRITGMEKSKTNITGRIVALLFVVVAATGLSINASGQNESQEINTNVKIIAEHQPVQIPDVPLQAGLNRFTDFGTPRTDNVPVIQDTVRTKLTGKVRTTYEDADGNEKDVVMRFKDDRLEYLEIDGKEIPESEWGLYDELINDTREEMIKAKDEIAKARIEIEQMDFEEINRKVEESARELENFDMEKLHKEMERARAELEEIDMEKIRAEMEEARARLEEIDMEKIRAKMEEARARLEEIDMEKMNEELERAKERIKDFDFDKINLEIEKQIKEIEDFDFENMKIEIQESLKNMDSVSMEEMLKELEEAEIDIDLTHTDIKADKKERVKEKEKK